MIKLKLKSRFIQDEQGAVAIITAVVVFFVLLGVAALAVDIGRLTTAKNEIQNAADAGALAGAGILFVTDTASNTLTYNNFNNIKNEAKKVSEKNMSMGKSVEIDINDISVGHWNFNNGFTAYNHGAELIQPSDVLAYIAGLESNESNYELLNQMNGQNGMPFFINAVQVVARSEDHSGFFSNVFAGSNNSQVSAKAVGYIGPAGSWSTAEFDYPIAVCNESLQGDFCNIGRMLEDDTEGDTAQWTNFSQPCSTADTTSVRSTLDTCGSANAGSIVAGESIGTTLGVVDAVFEHPVQSSFANCWRTMNSPLHACEADSPENPIHPWPMTLPVIACTEDQPNCRPLVSAVSVDVLWVLRDGNKIDRDAPCKMDDWDVTGDSLSGEERWEEFVERFDIRSPSGDDAHFAKKTVYFAPNCKTIQLGGHGGKEFNGVFSQIPVLVQ